MSSTLLKCGGDGSQWVFYHSKCAGGMRRVGWWVGAGFLAAISVGKLILRYAQYFTNKMMSMYGLGMPRPDGICSFPVCTRVCLTIRVLCVAPTGLWIYLPIHRAYALGYACFAPSGLTRGLVGGFCHLLVSRVLKITKVEGWLVPGRGDGLRLSCVADWGLESYWRLDGAIAKMGGL